MSSSSAPRALQVVLRARKCQRFGQSHHDNQGTGQNQAPGEKTELAAEAVPPGGSQQATRTDEDADAVTQRPRCLLSHGPVIHEECNLGARSDPSDDDTVDDRMFSPFPAPHREVTWMDDI
ncbi:uncharacterized protein LAESUDRAFT_709890 [Laetiporus sulphureus 93-53]|uniref:Uncharacterized protein n=1 Tax=Laetiporus sulphureus 93-53 TaxID=1314785 RepID=A0A165I777_9APHY|nr:uncharacterized protein LAESUDRAFT_709890 [Laetiporus sulphureus 93-53]KZT12684.1 hypothetical protein LAESUDRAFT_709890 [Laetiporus sulphureus 93-53]